MKKLLAAVALIIPVAVWAADTDSIDTVNPGGEKDYIMTITWQAAADGSKADVVTREIDGWITRVVTDPGSTVPADNYDITLMSTDHTTPYDVMGGTLANRDTANTETAVPKVDGTNNLYGPVFVKGKLTAVFTNQANADCDGEVHIYFSR